MSALAAGNTRQAACHYAGISDETLANWMRGSLEFLERVKKAEADAEVRMVAQVARAAQEGTWQAAAWWLERRRPEDYGRRDRVEVTLRREAERLASELGLQVDELIREAERLTGHG
ncbi:MAG TPA: hypothetical protein VKB73_11335 [Gaiellaceae bacterium]|nr:hypothetical protein [Gaiellaceae bacterium]